MIVGVALRGHPTVGVRRWAATESRPYKNAKV